MQVLLTRANNQLTVSQHIRQSCKYNIVPITITFVDDALDPPTADNLQFKRFMATHYFAFIAYNKGLRIEL